MDHMAANKLREFVSSKLGHNLLILSVAMILNASLMVFIISYAGRKLGPYGWGLIAFTMGFSVCISSFIEFGFNLSAGREVAQCRNTPDRLANVLADVLMAKLLLTSISVGAVSLAYWFIPIFNDYPALLWAGAFRAFFDGFNMLWYFRGLERADIVAKLSILPNIIAISGIYIFVQGQGDEWKVLLWMGIGSIFNVIPGMCIAYHTIPFRITQISSVWKIIREGWSMFLFRGPINIYTMGNAFILGFFVRPEFVGYYAGPEKIIRGGVQLLLPINHAFYPRISCLVKHSKDQAAHLIKYSTIIMGAGSLFMGIVTFIFAPSIIRILMGNSFEPAIPILRMFSVLPIFIAVSSVFGIQWMLSIGIFKPFNIIVLLTAFVNIVLAISLSHYYGHLGMSWALLISEGFIAIGICIYLLAVGKFPWKARGLNNQ